MWLHASASDPTTILLNQGVIGAMCVLLLGGIAYAVRLLLRAYKREQERADRLEGEVARLNKAIDDNYVGAMKEAVTAVAEALKTMRRSR